MVPASTRSASAPGSLMLLGEHAVLHGRRALACATDRRVTVEVTPREDHRVRIASALGIHEGRVDEIVPEGPLRFVLAAVREGVDTVAGGCDVRVTSTFSDQVGLGSSAAVTVACTAALHGAVGDPTQRREVFDRSLAAVRAVQGVGSGTDVAASLWGGIVGYRCEPFKLEGYARTHPIVLIYSGYKTPTTEVVAMIEEGRRQEPHLFAEIFDRMDECAIRGEQAVRNRNWPALGAMLRQGQELMFDLGVSDATLDDITARLSKMPGILGAKISGSGMGDCVLGLGTADLSDFPYESIPVNISEEGVRIEQT